MEKLFNFVSLLYTNKTGIHNAPFLILQNTERTESCVSRRNNETRYAGVRCLLFHYTRYLIVIPHFFSFSNCRDRCSTMRARFRVATSSFCFPHEFPHSIPSISDGSLKKIIVQLLIRKEKNIKISHNHNDLHNFHFQNLSRSNLTM